MALRKILSSALLTLIFLIFAYLTASAQNGIIRGFVYEKETGEPILFTNVYLYKTTYGATTDQNGFFTISKIPSGQYTLMVTYIGFDTLRIPLTVNKNDLFTKKLYLNKSSIELMEVSVSAAKQDKTTQTQTSIIKITPKEIMQIPTIGGQPDLAQYLQVLPGVIFSGDQGGQLYIRGGPPIQNKVLLDGMIIYNPFHSIGLFSVFDVDILKNVDVYTGGFNAEYGGRISSVMDITTRDGNRNRFAGKIDISTFGAKALFEGPIAKAKTEDDASASLILSVKGSYLEQSSKIFYNYVSENGLPYNYLDMYGKISINAPNGSKVNLYGFDFNDKVQYQVLQNYNWKSYGGGLNFVAIPGKSPVLLEGHVSYSYYKVDMAEVNKSPRSSSIGGFNVGLDFTYFFGKNSLRYGLEGSGYHTLLSFFNSINRTINYDQNTTEASVYAKYKWIAGKFVIEPGLRLQYYATLSNLRLEPRLAVKYNMFPTFRLKMAAGMYSQDLISTTYSQDVVSLFTGYLAAPQNLQKEFLGKTVNTRLQLCDQVIFGFEWDILKNLFLNVEGYYKYYPQLTTMNRNKLYDDSPENAGKPDYLKKDFILETGDAEGVDVSLKYQLSRLSLWVTYSLCFIHLYDGVMHYVPIWDRRNNLNLLATYLFGKKGSWELDARYNYGSGFPFTQTQGFYERLTFGDMGGDYTTNNGELGVLYADYNKGRLTYYGRLDLSLKKTFFLGKNTKLDATVSVTNALNEQNIFYFDRISYTQVNQLPIMPSAGLSITF
ncbi:MAG: carboxypeptidase-like regulatory domain-containing protein [Bacteroidetes bacterium]|nr:carboxypeptidase-like regulatory domain-containing protein [Bacteroidota bacterium]